VNRRGFLGLMVGGVALAAARSFPFRVFSFPKDIKPYDLIGRPEIAALQLERVSGRLPVLFATDGALYEYFAAGTFPRLRQIGVPMYLKWHDRYELRYVELRYEGTSVSDVPNLDPLASERLGDAFAQAPRLERTREHEAEVVPILAR
jgi:hypothetical protein